MKIRYFILIGFIMMVISTILIDCGVLDALSKLLLISGGILVFVPPLVGYLDGKEF